MMTQPTTPMAMPTGLSCPRPWARSLDVLICAPSYIRFPSWEVGLRNGRVEYSRCDTPSG